MRFWVEDQRYYAMALDGEKRQADAIGSNAGQCLWTGIVSPARARDVADRLLGPGAVLAAGGSGRTPPDQPGYNPFGYHTGTVWPHDTSLAAAGLKRYGFQDEANRIVGHVFEAAQHFDGVPPAGAVLRLRPRFGADAGAVPGRLLAAGVVGRGDVPVPLDDARPAGPRRPARAGAAPAEPARTGSARCTVTNLRVGDASVDLLFHRWRGTTSAEVLRKVGDVSVTIRL